MPGLYKPTTWDTHQTIQRRGRSRSENSARHRVGEPGVMKLPYHGRIKLDTNGKNDFPFPCGYGIWGHQSWQRINLWKKMLRQFGGLLALTKIDKNSTSVRWICVDWYCHDLWTFISLNIKEMVMATSKFVRFHPTDALVHFKKKVVKARWNNYCLYMEKLLWYSMYISTLLCFEQKKQLHAVCVVPFW